MSRKRTLEAKRCCPALSAPEQGQVMRKPNEYYRQAMVRYRKRLKVRKEAMSTKTHCLDCGPQPRENFYSHPRTIDGLNSYCKTCHKRRATGAVMRRRERNEQAGFPRSFVGPLVEPAGYLERHTQRRAEEAAVEATYQRVEMRASGPTDFQDAFGFGEKELSWSNAINKLLARPKKMAQWSTY